jgi:hypothetical protein
MAHFLATGILILGIKLGDICAQSKHIQQTVLEEGKEENGKIKGTAFKNATHRGPALTIVARAGYWGHPIFSGAYLLKRISRKPRLHGL